MKEIRLNELRAAYNAHEEANALLLRVNSTSMQARGTKHEKTAHAAKTMAKADAKKAREALMDAARDFGIPDMLFPDVLVVVRDALGVRK